ncbi:geranylgeranyltransferase subunit beta [Theileria orientalis strain Shintoku]|uniref:Geranylgeranyl transferase type-2 subunit beta n=1 Tax=Theileria orientalis strain Shintoku TaxID=869250 RepID=J4D8V9_THEOR|nr:geranylgeranyltransferase subunit beta [Theileria orientalis strain Shintoku]PVC50632.1 geranylgeranyltransferase subunit beta [Theileria orientalis]BAM41035.1 geranylgeranyltransferase subunit beta [Theileria orientalis strain Shintoku]|eukprot:XP_009691336.1 geranylgeranyltransferase subunit beta [Theileria orientalis strain Shintoku]
MASVKKLNSESIFKFLLNNVNDRVSIEGFAFEPIKLGGVYWCITAIALLKGVPNHIIHPKTNESLESMVMKILKSSKNDDGGFGFGPKHSSNIIATHYALLTLALIDKLDFINKYDIIKFISSLQSEDGSFSADSFGESDCRYSYSAISCLSLLGGLDRINIDRAVDFILSCKNFDGGFGWQPKTESHAAAAFCCVGALAQLNAISLIDCDSLGFWLCERQTNSGGFNGRPEKLPDICYSWWILSALHNIGRSNWVDPDTLIDFIIESQNPNDGGIAFYPGYIGDVCHTFFALCGISLIDAKKYMLQQIHPIYATTFEAVERIRNIK